MINQTDNDQLCFFFFQDISYFKYNGKFPCDLDGIHKDMQEDLSKYNGHLCTQVVS